jgi:hypothetical protein
MPDDVVLDGPDWGELDFSDESVALRFERGHDGQIVSHVVPVWFPPLKQLMPPKVAPRQARPREARPRAARRNGRTN